MRLRKASRTVRCICPEVYLQAPLEPQQQPRLWAGSAQTEIGSNTTPWSEIFLGKGSQARAHDAIDMHDARVWIVLHLLDQIGQS